jgi:hypothetical protein
MTTKVLRSRATAKAPPTRSRLPRRSSLPGLLPETAEVDIRLYSDVTASRPASPRGETFSTPVTGQETENKPVHGWGSPTISSEEDVPLATVTKARRALSLESPKRDNKYIPFSTTSNVPEQREIIQQAADLLTADEKDRIQKRQDVVLYHLIQFDRGVTL